MTTALSQSTNASLVFVQGNETKSFELFLSRRIATSTAIVHMAFFYLDLPLGGVDDECDRRQITC